MKGMKVIKIMPEYGTGLLWERKSKEEPFYNIAPKELTLSTSLIKQLEDLDRMYQNTFNEDYPPDSGFPSQSAESIFEKKGIEIWEALKSELPSEINVVYYSVVKKRLYENIVDLKK
jgi:hypothetical protein